MANYENKNCKIYQNRRYQNSKKETAANRYTRQTVCKENVINKKINANDCKYLDVFIAKIMAVVVNKYSKVTKSDFYIFVKSRNIDHDTKEETIRTYKIKRFNSYFFIFNLTNANFYTKILLEYLLWLIINIVDIFQISPLYFYCIIISFCHIFIVTTYMIARFYGFPITSQATYVVS